MARTIERNNEQRLLERFVNGESVPKLAQAYGTTEQIVREALLRPSVYSPTDQHRPDIPIANEVELIDRFVGGESISDLALAYRTREAQVSAALDRAGERMHRSLEVLDETSTDEDIKRVNAQTDYINRYTKQRDAETARVEARINFLKRYTDRMNEETERLNDETRRLNDQTERNVEGIMFLLVIGLIAVVLLLTSHL